MQHMLIIFIISPLLIVHVHTFAYNSLLIFIRNSCVNYCYDIAMLATKFHASIHVMMSSCWRVLEK